MNAGRSCTRLSAHTTTKTGVSARPTVGRREETGFVVPRAVNVSERLDREKTSTRLAHVVEGVACRGACKLDKLDPSRPESGQSRNRRHRPELKPEPATRQLRPDLKKERKRKEKENQGEKGEKRIKKKSKEKERKKEAEPTDGYK